MHGSVVSAVAPLRTSASELAILNVEPGASLPASASGEPVGAGSDRCGEHLARRDLDDDERRRALRLRRERRLGSGLGLRVEGQPERVGLVRHLGEELALVEDAAVGAALDRVHGDAGRAAQLLVVTELQAALADRVAGLERAVGLLDLLGRRLGRPCRGSARPRCGSARAPAWRARVSAPLTSSMPRRSLEDRVGRRAGSGLDEGLRPRRRDLARRTRSPSMPTSAASALRRRPRLGAGDLGLVDADDGRPRARS